MTICPISWNTFILDSNWKLSKMRRLKSETCVSKEAPCVRWYSQVCCNVVALQGQMKINVLPLPISASTSSVLPLLDSSGSPKKVSVWCWQSSAKVYCMHACCVLLSIALQGQIRLQAASSHWEKVSLVFGFRSLSDFWRTGLCSYYD